ncbi:MAG: phosphotransferase [Gammaproteobacteria bacterium]
MRDHGALKVWLAEKVNQPNLDLHPLPGDASFRGYYRFQVDGIYYLAMDASKEKESVKAFVGVAKVFAEKGVPVPQIFAYDDVQGFVLLADFGDELLLNHLSADNVHHWYAQALQILKPLARKTETSTYRFPLFDENRILRELNTFHEWCLDKLLGLEVTHSIAKLLNETYAALVQSALSQPQVMVHLDYHSRNLMIQRETGHLGVIDFQDAVIGPITYDLVSLTKDCYITWPENWVSQWVGSFYYQSIDEQIISKEQVSLEQFNQWYAWMGLQRHLKVLGVFSRLKLRDGKSGYIKDMPRVLRYILGVTGSEPTLKSFHHFIESDIQPRLERYWSQQGIEIAA